MASFAAFEASEHSSDNLDDSEPDLLEEPWLEVMDVCQRSTASLQEQQDECLKKLWQMEQMRAEQMSYLDANEERRLELHARKKDEVLREQREVKRQRDAHKLRLLDFDFVAKHSAPVGSMANVPSRVRASRGECVPRDTWGTHGQKLSPREALQLSWEPEAPSPRASSPRNVMAQMPSGPAGHHRSAPSQWSPKSHSPAAWSQAAPRSPRLQQRSAASRPRPTSPSRAAASPFGQKGDAYRGTRDPPERRQRGDADRGIARRGTTERRLQHAVVSPSSKGNARGAQASEMRRSATAPAPTPPPRESGAGYSKPSGFAGGKFAFPE